jgi:hypothetical protein
LKLVLVVANVLDLVFGHSFCSILFVNGALHLLVDVKLGVCVRDVSPDVWDVGGFQSFLLQLLPVNVCEKGVIYDVLRVFLRSADSLFRVTVK